MLIGRKEEQRELTRALEWDESAFIAVTGRRRVGKTYLVRETFNNTFTFQHTGLANQKTRSQLGAFRRSLMDCGLRKCRVLTDWFDAFHTLADWLRTMPAEGDKKILFIDEISWLDAPRSNFVSALGYFWNTFVSARKDMVLIICGSATSWIVNKVFRDRGGLHNRVTHRINLMPFTLHECELYSDTHRLGFTRTDILECYMVLGGVPFYWSLLERGLSVSQNIDRLLFDRNGKLHNEYNDLFDSLFKHPDPYIAVVSALGKKRVGMTREEIISEGDHITGNGTLTRVLEDLEACGFIRTYRYRGIKHRTTIHQLIDNYTLFYYKFLHNRPAVDEGYWSANINTPTRNSWEGLAFERVCFLHYKQIKQALGISGVLTSIYSWRVDDDPEGGRGAQIDMVIDRADRVVNLCEMKFSTREFAVTKDIDLAMRNKMGRFVESVGRNKAMHLTLITPHGVKNNMYQFAFDRVITADDLFKE